VKLEPIEEKAGGACRMVVSETTGHDSITGSAESSFEYPYGAG